MEKMKAMILNMCTPAQIYLFLALFACILGLFSGMKLMPVLLKLLFAVIWTFILNFLCKKGFKNVAWFLVLLPYVILFLVFLGLLKNM
jgi:hypothetical protein